jgi:hypothetical protein
LKRGKEAGLRPIGAAEALLFQAFTRTTLLNFSDSRRLDSL